MTIGLSPKALLAFCFPAITTLCTSLGHWAVTGVFDRTEIVTAAVGIAASAIAFVGAWLGSPGAVHQNVGTPSDELLEFPDES